MVSCGVEWCGGLVWFGSVWSVGGCGALLPSLGRGAFHPFGWGVCVPPLFLVCFSLLLIVFFPSFRFSFFLGFYDNSLDLILFELC